MVLTFLAFFPVLKNGYIWDDHAVTENPLLRTPEGLAKIWFSPKENEKEGHYWPLTYTTFWLEEKLWGIKPFGYHLNNVLLHIVNCVLLFLLLRKLGISYAFLAAMIFALHPVHVESVAWVIERKDVLSGMFYLLAFLSYVHFEKEGKTGTYLLSVALYTSAMLSKSVVISLPLAIAIWLWWRKGKLEGKDLIRLLPYVLIAVVMAILDVRFVRRIEGIDFDLSFVERILLASRAVWFYGEKVFVPFNLLTVYPRWEIDARSLGLYIFPVGLAGVLAVLWILRKKITRGPLAAVLFFVVTLGPTLGLINFNFMIYSYVADRFQYLASIGMILLAAGILDRFINKSREIKVLVSVLLFLSLGFLTWRQCGFYKNSETLFRHTARKNPGAWVAFNNIGDIYFKRGEVEQAEKLFKKALKIKPDYPEALTNLGAVLARHGKLDQALELYQEALDIRPNYPEALNNMGATLGRQGRFDEAIEYLEKAISFSLHYFDAHNNLGIALSDAGRPHEAIRILQKALKINPRSAKGYYDLGNVFLKQNRFKKAVEHYLKALEINPGYEKARQNLKQARICLGN